MDSVNDSLIGLLKELDAAYEWMCPEDQGKAFAAAWKRYLDAVKYSSILEPVMGDEGKRVNSTPDGTLDSGNPTSPAQLVSNEICVKTLRARIVEKWKKEADFAIKGGEILSADEELDLILGIVHPYLCMTKPVSVSLEQAEEALGTAYCTRGGSIINPREILSNIAKAWGLAYVD